MVDIIFSVYFIMSTFGIIVVFPMLVYVKIYDVQDKIFDFYEMMTDAMTCFFIGPFSIFLFAALFYVICSSEYGKYPNHSSISRGKHELNLLYWRTPYTFEIKYPEIDTSRRSEFLVEMADKFAPLMKGRFTINADKKWVHRLYNPNQCKPLILAFSKKEDYQKALMMI